MRRGLLVVVALIAVVAVIASVGAVSMVRRSMPETRGTVDMAGLGASVTVLRDDSGIPHIYGDSLTDLARAQGYVHAQERFFEMDVRRHVTSGTVAELIGAAGVASDKIVRTLGWRRVAEAELPTLKPATRQFLQAYADGVNAYLKGRSPNEIAIEYAVLATRADLSDIADWTPVDSLTWLKALAWDLRGDYGDELARARLSGRLTPGQIAELYPPYPFDSAPPVLSADDWSTTSARNVLESGPADGTLSPPDQARYAAVSAALAEIPDLVGRGEGVGSNAWVVSGERSATGKPLLANDPHLAPSQPGVWIQNSLHCRTLSDACPLDVSGFSFAGFPGVVIGHNAKIAWGMSNLGPDVSDFYLEKVEGENYLRDGKWLPLKTRQERIQVAGGEEQVITVRATGHGPLLSDAVDSVRDAGARAPTAQEGDENETHAVSLAWTGLTPGTTADAVLDLNLAGNFEEFRQAAKSFDVPAQNLLYADTEGHIGYQAPGKIPVRRTAIAKSPQGYWPAPGWDSTYDWQGFVPFDDLPYVLDPAEGYLVAANQAVTASARPFLTSEWDYGWRSTRIRARIEAEETLTATDMAAIAVDDRNSVAKVLVPALMGVSLSDATADQAAQDRLEFTVEARALLRGWDLSTPVGDSDAGAAAAYYNAVWANLCRLLFDDELPTDLRANGGGRYGMAVIRLLDRPKSSWWDNKLTPSITEGKDEILRQALVEARLELTKELGKDPKKWQWGKLHRLTLTHPVLGGADSPGILRWLVNEGPHDLPGGSAIVNANGWDASAGFGVNWAPSMRMVVNLADLDASTWINQTGVSGHPFAAHYSDQTEDWVAGRQRAWPFTEAAVKAQDPAVLTLKPEASSP